MSKVTGGSNGARRDVEGANGRMTFQRAFSGYYGPTARRPGPISARSWALTVISAAYLVLVPGVSPIPPDIRWAPVGGLYLAAFVLLLMHLRTWDMFGEKLYQALAEREGLGVGQRVLLWLVGWIFYAIAVFAIAIVILSGVSSWISHVT